MLRSTTCCSIVVLTLLSATPAIAQTKSVLRSSRYPTKRTYISPRNYSSIAASRQATKSYRSTPSTRRTTSPAPSNSYERFLRNNLTRNQGARNWTIYKTRRTPAYTQPRYPVGSPSRGYIQPRYPTGSPSRGYIQPRYPTGSPARGYIQPRYPASRP